MISDDQDKDPLRMPTFRHLYSAWLLKGVMVSLYSTPPKNPSNSLSPFECGERIEPPTPLCKFEFGYCFTLEAKSGFE
jgi:hypothetical protein